jgi:hypothetical protein
VLPIVLSAVAIFVASSITHTVLRYHWSDYQGMPDEAGVLAAMRKAGVKPGNYNFPHAKSMAELKEPEVLKKREQGPTTCRCSASPGRSLSWPMPEPSP